MFQLPTVTFWSSNIRTCQECLNFTVADPDPHYLNADRDPAFHINTDPDPDFHFNAEPDPAPLQSNGNLRPRVDSPPRLHLNFYLNADPDLDFYYYADSDPASKTNADPSRSGQSNVLIK
jgi:hypothetical protein